MPRAAILGAGLMGSAMAWPLSDNGVEVRLIGTHLDDITIESCKKKRFHPRLKRELPKSVKPYYFSEINEALQDCELIISGVNSLGIDWMANQLSIRLKPGQLVIGITKGLRAGNEGSVILYPQLLKAALPKELAKSVEFAAIGGPCIAGELAGRRPSFVMLASEKLKTAQKLASLLRTAYYFPIPTTDMLGLEISAALKNAYTVAVGIAYGILEKEGGIDEAGASMHNLAAALFAEGCSEIHCILRILRTAEWMAESLPGAGDLYVTSMGGRTVRFGKLLGLGKSFSEARKLMEGETLESIEIIKAMASLIPIWESKGSLKKTELPLMRTLIQVIVEGKMLKLPFGLLFQ